MLLATSNELGFPVLTLAILLPAAAGALVLLLDARNEALHYALGVFFSALTLVLASILLWQYDPLWTTRGAAAGAAFQFADPPTEPARWLPGGITYQVGVDGISIVLVFLTALLTPAALVYSWTSGRQRTREYVALMLVLETGLLGVFAALDLFLFYVFWELVLVPMYLLIGIWGGKERIYATFKFVLFTMAGSALMLVAIVVAVTVSGSPSFHLFDLLDQPMLAPRLQLALFAAFALSFAVKVPLFPFHTWLPDAHVEAPAAGSVMLAGVLLKMGAYGYVRFALPLFRTAAIDALPWLVFLALIGIWYGSWVAFAQKDLKSLVAYSSVAHLGIVMVGLFALNAHGMSGGVLQMFSHGLSTGSLFLLVGMLYDRAHTRAISAFGGLWTTMPRFSALFLIVMLASIGLPGTSGFVGEWLSLLGAFQHDWLVGSLAAFGVVFSAAYMLRLYQRVFFGPASELAASMSDIHGREMLAVAPLVLLVLLIGVYPQTLLEPISSASQAWVVLIDSIGP